MKIQILEPTKAYIDRKDPLFEPIKVALTYTNSSVSYLISKHMKNKWLKQGNPEAWRSRLEQLQSEAKRTLVFEDEYGYFIRPGSIPYLIEAGFDIEVENKVFYPDAKLMNWKTPPPFEPVAHQIGAVSGLISERHGGVELCTSAGKTYVAAILVKELGLRSVIVVPSKSIYYEVLEFCETHFGKDKVGSYGDGEKDIKKQITIAIGKSLTMVEPGSAAAQFFAQKQVAICDESHTFASTELDKVAHIVLAKVPYRFFMSGTQIRGDGGLKLLQSITGKIVFVLETKDGIESGFLSPIEFRIVDVDAQEPNYQSNDPGRMKSKHLLYNKHVLNKVASLANALAEKRNETSLILVEEIEQLAEVAKRLTVPFGYVHGNTTKKEELARLGITKSDMKTTLDAFNRGEIKVLIGTECISTGTNIFCHHGFNLQGGSSETGTRQGIIGRMVRRLDRSKFAKFHPPKTIARVWDFNVKKITMMGNHLKKRRKWYEDTGGKIIEIK